MYVGWLLLSLVLFPKFLSILLVVSIAPQRIHSFGHCRHWMAVRVMDTDVTHRSPETATVGSLCEVLLSSVQTTAMDVTAFVRRCRSARADLAPTTRELSELHMVLALLGGDHESQGGGGGPAGARKKGGTRIPKELQAHLRPVLTTCIAAVLRIDGILRQHGNDEGEDTPKWTAQARDEVRDLGRVLGTCRGVLGLVSDLVSILASSGSQGVTPDGLRLPDILGQLHNLLRSSSSSALTTSQSQSSNATLAGQQHQTLQAHLGHIIAYAETLAKSKDWEKAARALDEAQEKTAAAAEKEEVRGSIPVTAPLRKIPGSTSKATTTTQDAGGMGDNFIVLNRGFENFLVREDGGGRRCSASLLFAPTHRGPEPGSLMAGGPSTGMMIMDGAGLPGMSGTNHSLQPVVQGSTTTANPRQHLGRRTSSVIYTTEKEVAMPMPRDEVTEEALAFAQVPVHVLGRLSLNLVGHVYTGNNNHSPGQGNVSGGSSSADQTSYYNHSLLTVRTDEGCFDDGASARTSDAGSLHDGDLQFSQLDLSKPAPPPGAVSMSMSISQPLPLASPPSSQTTTTLVSRTPLFASQITIPASSSSQQPLPPPLALPPTQPLLPLPLPLPPSSSSQQQALPAMLTSTPAATSQPRPRPRPPPQPLQNSGSSSSNNPPEPGQQAPPPHHQQHHDERAAPTNVQSRSASAPLVYYGPPPPPPAPSEGHRHGLREMRSTSTMNTHAFMTAAMMNTQKPLPRTPLVYIPTYPGPFVKTKAVVVGNFSCGKTCLIT